MSGPHTYRATTTWTGNWGQGTATYRAYGREHEIAVAGKPTLLGSADPAFRGDADRWNPEDALLAAISACHMLWFLHLASEAGWVVERYRDEAEAVMEMNPDGSGQFSAATLRPEVEISAGDPALLDDLHHRAHHMCFIARSLNFEVGCEGTVTVVPTA
ncbi:MAG: OsmC family protein [Pseudomonadota bacterium]